MPSTDVVVVLTGVVAVVISLITALSSTRQSAFTQLEKVVEELRKSLADEKKRNDQLEKDIRAEQARNDKLEIMLNEEKEARRRVESWARRLVKQLKQNGLEPVSLNDTDGNITAIK